MKESPNYIEKITRSVGSIWSVLIHTVFFVLTFLLGILHLIAWDIVLLVLTTMVSLEAIYLAIFIQMSVNQASESLREVEVDVDEIQKDIDAIEHDVDEIQEDEAEEEIRDAQHQESLADISQRLQKLLHDIEEMKKK